jgi:hypothetical protein
VPADPVEGFTSTQLACADFAQLGVQSAAAGRDVLRTASSPHRVLDCPTPDQPYQSAMTDHQFQLPLRHLQVIIAILGLMAGMLLALVGRISS